MMLTDFRDTFKKVRVYRNLHKKCYSVVDRSTGRVCAHQFHVALRDATFRVGERGRQRVLKEKRKNVHAYVYGELLTKNFHWPNSEPREAYYNPYKHNKFVDKETLEPIESAAMVLLATDTIYYWKEEN